MRLIYFKRTTFTHTQPPKKVPRNELLQYKCINLTYAHRGFFICIPLFLNFLLAPNRLCTLVPKYLLYLVQPIFFRWALHPSILGLLF